MYLSSSQESGHNYYYYFIQPNRNRRLHDALLLIDLARVGIRIVDDLSRVELTAFSPDTSEGFCQNPEGPGHSRLD